MDWKAEMGLCAHDTVQFIVKPIGSWCTTRFPAIILVLPLSQVHCCPVPSILDQLAASYTFLPFNVLLSTVKIVDFTQFSPKLHQDSGVCIWPGGCP